MIEASKYEISIRYDGLEASEHTMDMGALGESMHGMSRVISTIGTFIITHRYSATYAGQVVRVKAGKPIANCVTISAVWDFISQQQVFSGVASSIFAAIFGWIVGQSRDGKQEMKYLNQALHTAIEAMANGNQKQFDRLLSTLERMAEGLRPAMRQAVEPVGRFCRTMTVNQAVVVDAAAADDIRSTEDEEISEASTWTVTLTELDLEKSTAKLRIANDPSRRISAVINDPAARAASNIYLRAFASGQSLQVTGKAGYRDDVIKTIYIFDARE